MGDVLAEDENASGIGLDQPGGGFHQDRLAGSRGAEYNSRLARVQLERDVVQRHGVAEAKTDIIEMDYRGGFFHLNVNKHSGDHERRHEDPDRRRNHRLRRSLADALCSARGPDAVKTTDQGDDNRERKRFYET